MAELGTEGLKLSTDVPVDKRRWSTESEGRDRMGQDGGPRHFVSREVNPRCGLRSSEPL